VIGPLLLGRAEHDLAVGPGHEIDPPAVHGRGEHVPQQPRLPAQPQQLAFHRPYRQPGQLGGAAAGRDHHEIGVHVGQVLDPLGHDPVGQAIAQGGHHFARVDLPLARRVHPGPHPRRQGRLAFAQLGGA
jgi:hypothetical protein